MWRAEMQLQLRRGRGELQHAFNARQSAGPVPRALSSESHRPSPLSERQNEGRTAEPSGPTDARRFGFFATCLLKLRLVSCTSSIICYP